MKTHAEAMAEHYAAFNQPLPDEIAKQCAKLDDPKSADVPMLSFKVGGKGETRMEVEAPAFSMICGNGKIWYFEIMVTSDAMANGIKAALNDEIKGELSLKWDQEKSENNYDEWKSMAMPMTPRILHKRLKVDEHSKVVHLLSAIDESKDLFVINRGSTLWLKLRDRMTTPTLTAWGEKIMPKIMKSGLILQAKTHNLGDGRYAYVLAPDAQKIFDEVVSRFVKEQGGFDAR